MADVKAGTKWSVASNPISRRRFVKGVIGGLAGGALAIIAASELHLIPTQIGSVIDQPSPWQLLDHLGRSSFAKHLGEDFWIHHDLFAIVPTRLVEVSASGLSNSVSQAGADEKHFTLVFEGPHEQPLSQKTYLFQHPVLGTFPLFIVPTTYALDLAAPLVQVLTQQDADGETAYLYGVTRIGEQQPDGWAYHLSDARPCPTLHRSVGGPLGVGSVRQLADIDGQVTLARGYTPNGEPLWSEGIGQSAYGFTGEDFDVSTGLVFLRARYMQPGLGIFLSRDPWMGYGQMPATHNGFNYAMGNPISLSDPTGFQSLPGVFWFLRCMDFHTFTPLGDSLGLQVQDSTTAGRAVEICKAAYSAANWNKDVPVLGFQLGQELPTRAHDLFGWFVHGWRGRFNSDRLYFDADQPLTREVIRTKEVSDVRNKYYNNDPDVG